MNKRLKIYFFIFLIPIISCNINSKNEFTSRLHTPAEKIDWYKKLGPTTKEKHFNDFEAIDWENDYWDQFNTGQENNTFLEVMDEKNNTFIDVSTFPYEDNTFQFAIYVGSRTIKDNKNEVIQQGYVRCYLLGSNDKQKVKDLISLLFERDYQTLFKKIDKLNCIFETESLYQNIN
ncbi:hypothetical protein [Marinifilum fragile]|uniref:hypothetical protein n=1 Tax=Marinifilum fragile TaxID=570161 RepID=UPI002AAA6B98|nr:hypothetical protein [Marinifilum fragile]